jgi:hypothetical protein
MIYAKEFVEQWVEEIYNIAKKSNACSCAIPYGDIDSFDPTEKECQQDIYEYVWDYDFDDNLRAIDFNDEDQLIIAMWYMPPKKELKEEKEMKKYTLKEWKEFCEDALIMPPFEDDEQIEEWFNTHKIHIATNNCVMELEYDADAVNEIEFSLREIYEAIHGSGNPTTGNTTGSEYPNATWKDILRCAVLQYHYDGMTLKEAIGKCIVGLNGSKFQNIMREINSHPSLCHELQVNLSKLDTSDLWKIFDKEERRKAFKEILCSDIRIEELYDKDGCCADKVVITDYSIKMSGDLVGWHYGVDWDKDSEDNQYYIDEYIKEMIG